MPTPHISAPEGAFAKTVLMPGDPLRAQFIAENFLANPKLVTSVRNVLGYTGSYKGIEVSVMASGMGMPSIGIYSYELFKFYHVENIIRIGSAGSYRDWLKVMDVTLAKYAYSDSTFALRQGGVTTHSIEPSKELNDAIIKNAKKMNIECKMSVVHSSDVFYSDSSQESWQDLAKRTGSDCVEMESFALFHNANALGKRAACLLTISDSFVDKVERFVYGITALRIRTAPPTLAKFYNAFISVLQDWMVNGSLPNATGMHLEVALRTKVNGSWCFYCDDLFRIYDLNVRNKDF